jgi:hypothetical protein
MRLNRKGSVLFEAALGVCLLTAVLYRGHLEVVKRWKLRLRALETERLRYDGEILWKP